MDESELTPESFTLIFRKSVSLQDVALCPTMDLVAFILKGTSQICVHRSFSWERIFSIASSDLFASPACKLSWCPSGRLLVVGGEKGEIVILDVEHAGEVIDVNFISKVYTGQNQSDEADNRVLSISWLDGSHLHSMTEPYDFDVCTLMAETYSNQTLPELLGDVVLKEENESFVPDADIHFAALHQGLGQHIMLVAYGNGTLCAYALGYIKLFEIPMAISGSKMTAATLASGVFREACCLAVTLPPHEVGDIHSFDAEVTARLVPFVPLQKYWRVHQLAQVLLQAAHDIQVCSQVVNTCGRQWKDAPKVLKMKFNLLKDVMNGYGMKSRPSDLLYSTTMCGLWHAAAAQHFAQHWNQQGLVRLRSSIDSCTKDMLRHLRLRVLPIAVNLVLRAQYLLALCYSSDILPFVDKWSPGLVDDLKAAKQSVNPASHAFVSSNILNRLLEESKKLVHKAYEAFQEAILTRDRMMTLLTFIHDASDRSKEEIAEMPAYDPQLTRRVMQMFDPRLFRKMDDAEEMTATHLYAYFSRNPLPQELITERGNTGYFAAAENAAEKAIQSAVQGLCAEEDVMQNGNSLSSQILILDDLLNDALRSIVAYTNERLTASPFNTSLSVVGDFDSQAISIKVWRPIIVDDDMSSFQADDWHANICLAIADGTSSLYILLIPQCARSVNSSRVFDDDDSVHPAQLLGAKVLLEDIAHVHKVSIYSAVENAPKKNEPCIVALGMSSTPQLVKITLQDIRFHLLESCTDTLTALPMLQKLEGIQTPCCRRSLLMEDVTSDYQLITSGGRGTCVIVEPDGRFMLFDLEEDEQQDDNIQGTELDCSTEQM